MCRILVSCFRISNKWIQDDSQLKICEQPRRTGRSAGSPYVPPCGDRATLPRVPGESNLARVLTEPRKTTQKDCAHITSGGNQ
jgi:hypothetical protein